MPDLDILQAVSSGLRGALAILWATLLLRLWSSTRNAPAKPKEWREKAWQWQRAGLTLLGVAVVGFYCPEDILRAQGAISAEVSFLMGSTGSFLQALAMSCILAGLDILTTGSNRAAWVYFSIGFAVPICAVSML